jgi:hypothetical protein
VGALSARLYVEGGDAPLLIVLQKQRRHEATTLTAVISGYLIDRP